MNRGFNPRPGSSGQKTMGLIHSNETHPVWGSGGGADQWHKPVCFSVYPADCVSALFRGGRGGVFGAVGRRPAAHTRTHARRNYIMFDLVRFFYLACAGTSVARRNLEGSKFVGLSVVFPPPPPPIFNVFILCFSSFFFFSCG